MFINFARIKAYAVDKIKLIGYIYVCVAVLSVAGADCHAMMQREQTLDEAAILMYEMPDSAMLVVEKTEPRLAAVLSADKTEADSVANAVFNYYRKHGSRREKFDMYYIIGRLHQLRGNEESAMFCYISADEAVHVRDILNRRSVKYISAFVGGGDYKIINEDGTFERFEDDPYIRVSIGYK